MNRFRSVWLLWGALVCTGCGVTYTIDGKTIDQWSAQLTSDREDDRRLAVEKLEKFGEKDTRAVKYLIQAAQHSSNNTAMQALRALGRLGTQARSALPQLNEISAGHAEAYIRSEAKLAIDAIEGAVAHK
jgi:HEAT repeat protein